MWSAWGWHALARVHVSERWFVSLKKWTQLLADAARQTNRKRANGGAHSVEPTPSPPPPPSTSRPRSNSLTSCTLQARHCCRHVAALVMSTHCKAPTLSPHPARQVPLLSPVIPLRLSTQHSDTAPDTPQPSHPGTPTLSPHPGTPALSPHPQHSHYPHTQHDERNGHQRGPRERPPQPHEFHQAGEGDDEKLSYLWATAATSSSAMCGEQHTQLVAASNGNNYLWSTMAVCSWVSSSPHQSRSVLR